MPKEFIIRGQTAHLKTEVLNMTGFRPGYGYRITEFKLYPSAVGQPATWEMAATISATAAAIPPDAPNFNEDGLVATAFNMGVNSVAGVAATVHSKETIINDLFVITQDLILMVQDQGSNPVNWHVKFKEIKMSSSAEAVANYKQYTIYNTSS